MWKEVLLVGFVCAVLPQAEAQAGAESLLFHGYIPGEAIREQKPIGDKQPNDVYLHLEPTPFLADDEDVYYPPSYAGFGLEYGQDPEEAVYQVYTAAQVEELRRKKQQGKHSKHAHSKGKGGHSKGLHKPHSKPTAPPPTTTPYPPPPPPPPSPSFHSAEQYRPRPSGSYSGPSSHESFDSYPRYPSQYRQQPTFPPRFPHQG